MIRDLRKPAATSATGRGRAVLGLGFRPFFLLGALFAAGVIPAWLLVVTGAWTLRSRFVPSQWHAHEMLHGFVAAIVAGFLLTAVRNWTSQPTPSGLPLAGLVALWLAGRVAMVVPLPAALAAALDLAFLPAVAVVIAVPIVRTKNLRNLGFVPLLLLLAATNALFHLARPDWTSRALQLSVDVVLLVVVVMGGRVIPSFTGNALRVPVRRRMAVEVASLASVGVVAILDAVPGLERAAGVAAIAAGLANALRMATWHGLATRGRPILWVLHAGYAWIAVGFVLEGIAALVPAWSHTAAIHALTVGAMGVLILGMTSRVSLGHTGRLLEVPRTITLAYVLLVACAAVRAVGPLVLPELLLAEIVISGVLWVLAFAAFVLVYAPILTGPRVDGKPG